MDNMGNLHSRDTHAILQWKIVTAWPVHQTLRCLDQYLLDDVAMKNLKFHQSDFNEYLLMLSELSCDANNMTRQPPNDASRSQSGGHVLAEPGSMARRSQLCRP